MLCKINVCRANGSTNAGYRREKRREAKPNFKKISNRFMRYFGYFSPMLKIGSAKTTDVRANPSHCNRSFHSLPCARISPHTLSAPAFFSVKVTLYESKVLWAAAACLSIINIKWIVIKRETQSQKEGKEVRGRDEITNTSERAAVFLWSSLLFTIKISGLCLYF